MNFRFLDRVVSFDPGGSGRIVTLKTIPRAEDYSEGPFHTPSTIPSSLVLETIVQSGGQLLVLISQDSVFPLLLKVEEAGFFSPVAPGDVVQVCSELLAMQDQKGESVGLARVQSHAMVGDKPVAEARILFLCVPTKELR